MRYVDTIYLMRKRSEALELTILGLLAQGPMHGYELRKRMLSVLGPFRGLAFSVLYPQLHRMMEEGSIEELEAKTPAGKSRRKRIVYAITDDGQKAFESLVKESDADAWSDENFEVRFAFFGPTPKSNRLRILEGRLRRLTEKAEVLQEELKLNVKNKDTYLAEWRRHSLDAAEREISWLQEMINTERKLA